MRGLLPPDPPVTEDPDLLLDRVDALLLAGGVDYGEAPERDAFETALARRAMERDLPLLGVCRGMQLMNVARGGTLLEHLPDVVGHDDHRAVPGAVGDDPVRLTSGSLAARAAGSTLPSTKSHHHQGVDRLGDGFEVTGWAVVRRL